MSAPRILFVGAKPELGNTHAGGQLTASLGLADYAREHGIDLDIVDSAQSSFPPPPLWRRIGRALHRLGAVSRRLLRRPRADGAILFASAGFSLYEKLVLAGLCRLAGVRTLLFVRSGHVMAACEASPRRRRRLARLLRIPHLLGAQGENWRRWYRDMGIDAERIVLVRNWLAPGRACAREPKRVSGAVTFAFVGWLVEKKGVNELIDAVAASPVLRACRVVLAGGGTLLEPLRARVEREGLDHVELPGWLSPQDVDRLLAEAHVFVLPSHAEGFPNALLEAMSQGLAAIVTPVGAIPDSARDGENAIVVPPGDATALRVAMEALAGDPARIARYSRRSLELCAALHDRDRNCAALIGAVVDAPPVRP